MMQDKAKETGSPTECAEIFCIRPKAQHPERTCSSDKNEVKTLKEFDYNVLMDIHNSLQLLIKDREVVNGDGHGHGHGHGHDDDDDGDEDEEKRTYDVLLYDILRQALAWWAVALTFENFLGKRVVDKRKVPSIARAKLNTSTLAMKPVCREGSQQYDQYTRCLHELPTALGFSIVEIPKNGNCLSTAVAFQLHQLQAKTDVSNAMAVHLENLGIKNTQSVEELATLLRKLVVDEWVGSFSEDYLDFFHGEARRNYVEEAEKYRMCGTFAGPLGDAMPLALAIVLGMPFIILSLENSTPFLDVCPREIKCELFPLYLAHYPTGPGHYDTRVSQSDTPTTMFTANENEPGSTHGTETTLDKLFRPCRCGVNTKSQRSTRKYSFRCSCIKSSAGSCRSSCKCLGSCGGSKCRDLEVKSEETKAKRKSRKRGIQQLQ